jgi:hypothetical protein
MKAWLHQVAESQQAVLAKCSDLLEMGRAQGRLEIVRMLIRLEDDLVTHDKKIQTGEVGKPTERTV